MTTPQTPRPYRGYALAPCKCGNRPTVENLAWADGNGYWVECKKCKSYTSVYRITPEAAINDWNNGLICPIIDDTPQGVNE